LRSPLLEASLFLGEAFHTHSIWMQHIKVGLLSFTSLHVTFLAYFYSAIAAMHNALERLTLTNELEVNSTQLVQWSCVTERSPAPGPSFSMLNRPSSLVLRASKMLLNIPLPHFIHWLKLHLSALQKKLSRSAFPQEPPLLSSPHPIPSLCVDYLTICYRSATTVSPSLLSVTRKFPESWSDTDLHCCVPSPWHSASTW
jgi:hypothetical protein